MASRKLVEETLLYAIKDDLYSKEGQAVFSQEVARLLAERRRTQKPDLKQAPTRLKVAEQEIANIMTAIKAGILTMTTKGELEQAEAERARLLHIMLGQYKTTEKVTAFLPNAIGRLKVLIEDLENATQLQVDKARGLLR